MAETADSVIVALEAQVSGFNREVKNAEGGFTQSMSQIERSAGRAEASIRTSSTSSAASLQNFAHASGSARAAQAELMHVARAASDQFAAGTPILQIFAQHLAQIAQVISLSGGGFSAAGPKAAAEGLDAAKDASESLSGAVSTAKETSEQLAGALGHGAEASHANTTATAEGVVATRSHTAASALDVVATDADSVALVANAAAAEGAAAATTGLAAAKAGLARLLAGPWGIAIIAAITILGSLTSKLGESGNEIDDLVEKMRRQAEQSDRNDEAAKRWADSVDGVRKAEKDLHEQLDKQDGSLSSEAEKTLEAASANLKYEEALRKVIAARYDDLLARRDAADLQAKTATTPDELAAGQAGVSFFDSRIAAIQKERDANAAALKSVQQDLDRARSFVDVEQGKKLADPIEQIRVKYEGKGGLIESARRRAAAEHTVGDALQRQIRLLTEQENREIAAEQKRQHPARENDQQFGRSVSISEAKAIAERAGLHVTSASRTRAEQQRLYNTVRTAENPVALPGHSAHERGNALDIAFAPGVSIASIRKTFADEGVRLTKILKETGHFHVEFANDAGKEIEHQVEATTKAVKRLTNDAKNDIAGVASEFRSVEGRLDPAAAAAREFRHELVAIENARLGGMISDSRALELRFEALARAVKPLLERMKEAAAVNERLDRQNQRDGKPALRDKKDALDQEQRHAEGQIRDLAGLYEDLFTGGVHSLWDDFKREGLRALSLLAAQQTFKLLTGQELKIGQGQGGGDLFSQLFSAAASIFGGGGGGPSSGSGGDISKALGLFKAIGFSSGGYTGNMGASQVAGVVHGGEYVFDAATTKRLGVGNLAALHATAAMPRAAPASVGSPTVVHQHFTLDLRGGVTTPQLLQGVKRYVDTKAGEAGSAAYGRAMRDAPGRLQEYDALER